MSPMEIPKKISDFPKVIDQGRITFKLIDSNIKDKTELYNELLHRI